MGGRFFLPIIVLLTTAFTGHSQENVLTVGIQFKPMVPLKFITDEPEPMENEGFVSTVKPQFGMNLGMVIRRGITKMWSFETGINFVQRNYSMKINHPEMPVEKTMNYRFIGYEIPIQGLVYVKLTDRLYMNASGGLSLDFFPSNIETFSNERKDTTVFDFHHKTVRRRWLQFSMIANYGFEYRTKSKGYYYLGISYHRPFNLIGVSFLEAQKNRDPARMDNVLKGDYLTLDLRYFFHEKPSKKISKI